MSRADDRLTRREMWVLVLMSRGWSNQQMADRLRLSLLVLVLLIGVEIVASSRGMFASIFNSYLLISAGILMFAFAALAGVPLLIRRRAASAECGCLGRSTPTGRSTIGRSTALCVVSLAVVFSAMACSGEDSSRRQSLVTTSIPDSTLSTLPASVTEAPVSATVTAAAKATPAVRPKDYRTGIGTIDAVLDGLASGKESALIARLHFVSVPCAAPGPGLGGVPECPNGVPVGTTITAIDTGACHGVVLQEFDRLPTQLQPLIGLDLRVSGVAEIERLPAPEQGRLLPASHLLVLEEAAPRSPFPVWVVRIDEVGIVGVFNGCYLQPQDVFTDGSLGRVTRVVVPPLG